MTEAKKEINKEAISEDIISMFDSVITKGRMEEDFKIADGLTVTMKVLNTGELLSAESEASTNRAFMPLDIVNRGRIVSILTRAITSVNGVDIEQDSLSNDENEARRTMLYRKLMELPPDTIEKAHADYVKLKNKQADALSKPIDDLLEDVNSF